MGNNIPSTVHADADRYGDWNRLMDYSECDKNHYNWFPTRFKKLFYRCKTLISLFPTVGSIR